MKHTRSTPKSPLASAVRFTLLSLAAAASLVMGQADEAQPAVLVRGLTWKAPNLPASELIRASTEDLFR